MGWRPSDRNGVVLWALQRATRPMSAADVTAFIHDDATLRKWWYDLPTPGQSYKPIKLSSQNVENRLIALERRWTVIVEDGKHPNYAWTQRQYRIVEKDEREAIRLRLQTKLNVPPVLERKALAAARELGLRVEFFTRMSDYGYYFAVCRIESKRGEAEHEKWLIADIQALDRAEPGYVHDRWEEMLADAGLIER